MPTLADTLEARLKIASRDADNRSEDLKQWSCTNCGRSAAVRIQEFEEAAGVCTRCRELAERRENWAKTLLKFGVPPRYATNVPADLALPAHVADWSGDPWCVVFTGENGRGKTWASTSLFGRSLIDGWHLGETVTRHEALWANVAWCVEMQRQAIGSEYDSHRIFDKLCAAKLLLLDDWASMRRTEYGEERMRLVIEHRYDYELPTIITCDRPLKSVEARLASRIAERGSDGRSYIVKIGGEDRRRTNNGKEKR